MLIPSAPVLHNDDMYTIRELYDALRSMCKLAQDYRIRIAFDAEQSWLQGCLDRLVSLLSAEFNTRGSFVVYNTYQANLRQTTEALQRDLQQARSQGETDPACGQ